MKPIKENSVKTRRQFDETFKREAVQNWLTSGKSAEVIAQELV
jgi:transposase-like protein